MTQSTAVGGRCQAICGAREGGERFRGREKKRPRCDGEAKKRGRVQGGIGEFLSHMVNKMLTTRHFFLRDLAAPNLPRRQVAGIRRPGVMTSVPTTAYSLLISTVFGIR